MSDTRLPPTVKCPECGHVMSTENEEVLLTHMFSHPDAVNRLKREIAVEQALDAAVAGGLMNRIQSYW